MKSHKEKIKIARRLQTHEELTQKGKGLFETSGWEERSRQIAERVKRKEADVQQKRKDKNSNSN